MIFFCRLISSSGSLTNSSELVNGSREKVLCMTGTVVHVGIGLFGYLSVT
jgi:hypothetical protein